MVCMDLGLLVARYGLHIEAYPGGRVASGFYMRKHLALAGLG